MAIKIHERSARNARILGEALDSHMLATFSPDSRKTLRSFSPAEAAELLGINVSHLRKLHHEDRIPDTQQRGPGDRRQYRAEDINNIRQALEKNAKIPHTYMKGRDENSPLKVITCVNFKGGSGKSTSTIHLGQRLALRGYRVLVVDIDPQASLTGMFGYFPEREMFDGGTVYDAIKYDDKVPLSEVILKTYFPNLDLVPGGLILQEFEHDTPRALVDTKANYTPFYLRLANALSEVEANYDLVIIDCPPQMGYLTMSAICASTGALVTIVPAMLDVASMRQFLSMTAQLLNVISETSGGAANMDLDFMQFLVNRYEPNDGPQQQMLGLLRSLFGDQVMTNPVLKSTAISDAGLTQQTVYEMDRSNFNRATYDRAVESLNAVGNEVEALIQKSWGR